MPFEEYPMERRGAERKLGRGLANLAFGWVEIFKGIDEVHKDRDSVVAASTWGTVRGATQAGARTLTGVYEIVTFPFPDRKDYAPQLEPEFVLDKPKKRY